MIGGGTFSDGHDSPAKIEDPIDGVPGANIHLNIKWNNIKVQLNNMPGTPKSRCEFGFIHNG